DLLLGVDLKHAFEAGFGHEYPENVQTSAEAIVWEFDHDSYLRRNYLLPEDYAKLEETMVILSNGPRNLIAALEERAVTDSEILSLIRDLMQTYLMTSNTHFGLARKYVPVDAKSQEQIGSSGTNIQKFLKEGLIDGRAKALRDFEARHSELRPLFN